MAVFSILDRWVKAEATGILRITHIYGSEAKIFLNQGQIVGLEVGNLKGLDAAQTLAMWVSISSEFLEGVENPKFVSTFLRMEKWIFDSPDMAGEVFREWIRDILQQNLLIKNQLVIEGQKVDLRNIKCPLLNVFGKNDYLAPPSTAKPLSKAVGSKDVTTMGVDSGHVGIFVGSKSYKTISPKIAKWIRER